MKLVMLAACGGALGAAMRHLVNTLFSRMIGGTFPWQTMFVNIVGSLLMGVLIVWFASRLSGSLEARTFLATGILGGFTTFSAFSLDFATLLERGDWPLAVGYATGSVVVSILALFAGLWFARAVLT